LQGKGATQARQCNNAKQRWEEVAAVNSKTNILITGASGLLGSALTARLEGSFSITGTGFSQATDGLFPVDLRDSEALKGLLQEVNPDVVVHSAAYRDPDFCEEYPEEAYRLNVAPAAQLCELLPESVPLLFISSDYVFDGVAAPYREEDERRPVNEYGRLKVQVEDLVLQRDAGSVLRIPLLIGAGPTWESSGFIFKTLAQIQDPTPSSLDHAGIRFPTWTNDVAEAVAHMLGMEAKGVYHYSSLEGGTKYDWAGELADLTGLSMEHITPNPDGSASRAQRPGNTQLVVEKTKRTGLGRFTPFREVARSVLQRFSVMEIPSAS
jgi:dTDP-4-dehydrorhamnose reductase